AALGSPDRTNRNQLVEFVAQHCSTRSPGKDADEPRVRPHPRQSGRGGRGRGGISRTPIPRGRRRARRGAMKFGVVIRNMGPQSTRETITTCARAVEQAGFDAAFVVDHLAIPPDQTEGSGGRYLDPLTTLAYLAGVTQRIRLGVSVLVIPYRPAVLTAKQIATLQELSGERLILGAGVGWLRQEFEALGVDPRKRGALTDETLQVLHTLFANDVNAYEGKLVRFPAFVFAPRPA